MTDTIRKGGWIQTFTGKAFYPLDPVKEDICIEDIAHSLSLQVRFVGHTRVPCAVGQHCLMVMNLCRPGLKLAALLHDASEAYLLDMPSPIKQDAMMQGYCKAHDALQDMIFELYGIELTVSDQEEIKIADRIALATERRDLMGGIMIPWIELPRPLETHIHALKASVVEARFLRAFDKLCNERGYYVKAS